MHDALQQITEATTETNSLLECIADSTRKQTDSITMLGDGMSKLDAVTQRNAHSSGCLASSAEETSGQVLSLDNLVKVFRVEDE